MMKQALKSGIKIYLFILIYVLLSSLIYAFILNSSKGDFNALGKLIVGGLGFFFLGFAFANAFHKKGLLIGLIVGLIHFFIVKLSIFLAIQEFDFSVLIFFIQLLMSGIGGLLGVNLKKLF